jgi:hypothetical protein
VAAAQDLNSLLVFTFLQHHFSRKRFKKEKYRYLQNIFVQKEGFNDRRKWLNPSDATSDTKLELHVYI